MKMTFRIIRLCPDYVETTVTVTAPKQDQLQAVLLPTIIYQNQIARLESFSRVGYRLLEVLRNLIQPRMSAKIESRDCKVEPSSGA